MTPPASTCEIREFRMEDLGAARRLWALTEGLGRSPGDSDRSMKRFLERNPGLSFVALDGATIAASILCGHDGRRGVVYRLAVAPAYRRRGLAADLVARCLEGLQAAGVERCFALVETDNEGGRKFWEEEGWIHRDNLVLYAKDP